VIDHAPQRALLGNCGKSTVRGLHLRADLAFEDWLDAGRQIARFSSASAWWIGDWVLYGERTYGRRYRAALDLTGLDYKTLRNYAWVARTFEMSRRQDNLSFHHHAEVAGLTEPEQDLWLRRAQQGHWSRNELRRQLASDRLTSRDDPSDRATVLRLQVAADRERHWREAAITAHQDLLEWVAAVADAAADVVLRSHEEPEARGHARGRVGDGASIHVGGRRSRLGASSN
jgi:hypothetical protein